MLGIASCLEEDLVGILLVVNKASVEVLKVVVGDYAVKFHVCWRLDGFKRSLIAVYGMAQQEFKLDFLVDLVCICVHERLPIMVGGDFNIIRCKEDKNNDKLDGRWSFMFNAIIESLDLQDIALTCQ